ncbi:MAG TPA: 3-dehydroquinate synthase [Stellaceae bacterium]|nr:3-dehydroquinate synthase [Stellaceae bacterium]
MSETQAMSEARGGTATRLTVGLGERGYDIVVGTGLLDRAGALVRPLLRTTRVLVLTDETVAALHLARLTAGLAEAGIEVLSLAVPAGEASKDIGRFPALMEKLLDLGVERGTTLVALGGGVVGDLAGFAAATLLRGIDFIQVPTTLLAQVDSSVGGKTGLDTKQGKNLVGAFHQPRLVLADLATLGTLPRRELLAGYAELVKYGLIGDAAFYAQMEAEAADLLDERGSRLGAVILEACRMKAAVVAEDEREGGRRALLNFGHTFGHALEAETGYGDRLLHGEAVAVGMALAFETSVRLGHCPAADALRARRHLAAIGLPTRLDLGRGERFDPDRLLAHMQRDKKVADGRIGFVLTRGIGTAFVDRSVPLPLVRDVLIDFA